MINFKQKDRYTMEDLKEIMALLRSPEGCPWDREQTHDSIRRNFVEEVYEAIDAIDRRDDANLREELGDVLLQVVFHARIAQEGGRFDLDDVTDEVCKKLVRRHPHIFGGLPADTSEEALKNWDQIKKEEKGQKTASQSLEQISISLPALLYADKMQSRAAKGGWTFAQGEAALEELDRRLGLLRQAAARGETGEQELGELLFAAVQAGRDRGIDPEKALYQTSRRFLEAFRQAEENRLEEK